MMISRKMKIFFFKEFIRGLNDVHIEKLTTTKVKVFRLHFLVCFI